MAEPQRRMISGLVTRGEIKNLREMNLFDAVLARVNPETRALMERPPLSITKVPAMTIDEITRAVIELKGRDAGRDLSIRVMRESAGPILRPLVKSLISMFGGGPHAIYGNLGTIGATMSANLKFEYEKRGPTNGVVTLSHDEPASPAWFVAWEGVLFYAFELSGVTGEVWPHEADPDMRRATFRARWDLPTKP